MLDVNPILSELDGLSPQAKSALQQAHSNVAGVAPAIAPAAPPPPPVRPMPAPGASSVPTLGPAVTPPAPANPMASAHSAELGRLTTGDTGKSGIAQIKNPFARVGLQIADAIGGGFFPGLEQRIPGTEGHHDVLVRQAQRNVTNDEAAAVNEAKNTELGARTQEEDARAHALLNPPEKEQNVGKTITNDQGIMQWNPATQRYDIPAGKASEKPEAVHPPIADDQGNLWFQHPDGTVTPVMANGKQLKAKQAPEKTVAPEQQYIDEYQKLHPGSTIADAIHHYGIDSQQPQRPPQVVMFTPDGQGGATANVVRPGQTVAPGSMTAAGFNTSNVPTSNTRTMVESAPIVLDLAKRIDQLVDEQANQLGPAKSRWSEFMAGKVGSPNPEFTKLRTDVGLLSTKLMQMHVGSRGGERIMEHFQKLIDSGVQSPENLKAALSEIETYARSVEHENPAKAAPPEQPMTPAKASGTVTVQIPGHPPGQIDASQKDAFMKRFPNAKVVQ